MKVLAVSGSPRIEGNSDVLCNEFLKGAKEAGHKTEKISLAKVNLKPCIACYSCRTDSKCIHNDIMEVFLDKMIDADIILLATPVYFYSMVAQMKLFIDRSLPRYQEIKNKKFYFAVTAADPSHEAMEATLEGFRGYTACLPEAEEVGVFYGTGAWEKGDILKMPILESVYMAGKQIV